MTNYQKVYQIEHRRPRRDAIIFVAQIPNRPMNLPCKEIRLIRYRRFSAYELASNSL